MTPVFVCSDRYGGVYAGGAWWAVANADAALEESTRLDWVLNSHRGPWSDDSEAIGFWSNPPDWIAIGDTPDQACEALGSADLRRSMSGRGLRTKYWSDEDFQWTRPHTFEWYGAMPTHLQFLSLAALQNRHAASSSSDAWIAFDPDQHPKKDWRRLLGDEDDFLWLLVEEKDSYCTGATPTASIRNLVDMMMRRVGTG